MPREAAPVLQLQPRQPFAFASRVINNNDPGLSDNIYTRSCKPIQPKRTEYPITRVGKTKRMFSVKWFEEHRWVEWSEEKDAAFCFPCRYFDVDSKTSLATTGWRDWGNAYKIFPKHALTRQHITSVEMLACRRKADQTQITAMVLINKEYAARCALNRENLHTIITSVRYLACQTLSFRGQDESESSIKKGNDDPRIKIAS